MKTPFEDAVYVQEAIVMVHAAVAVAVHDHVHLAGAGHALIGVGAVDAAVGELPHARTFGVLVEFALELGVFFAEQGGFDRVVKIGAGRDFLLVLFV